MAESVALACGHVAGENDVHGARLAGQEQRLAVGEPANFAEAAQSFDFLRRQRRESLRISGVGFGRDRNACRRHVQSRSPMFRRRKLDGFQRRCHAPFAPIVSRSPHGAPPIPQRPSA